MLTYASPVSNDAVSIAFRQRIAADRGPPAPAPSAKTLTFTLAITTPGYGPGATRPTCAAPVTA